MPITSLTELYLDELEDLYDAETQAMRTLPRFRDAARTPELRHVLARHGEESRLHLERLQLIFTHWGQRRPTRVSPGLAGIVQEADDRLNDAATDEARDGVILAYAQRMAHYEIAAYGCARACARRLNRSDEERLLQETLDAENRVLRRLTEVAQGVMELLGSPAEDRRTAGCETAAAAVVVAGPFVTAPGHEAASRHHDKLR